MISYIVYMRTCETLLKLVSLFLCAPAVRGRGGTNGWRHGHAMWTSSKRISSLCLSIRSELKTWRGALYRLCIVFWYITLHTTPLCCLFRAHWYLVVICFPGLDEAKSEAWNGPNSQTGKSQSGTGESQDQEVAEGSKSPNENTETPPTPPTLNHTDNVDTETGMFD